MSSRSPDVATSVEASVARKSELRAPPDVAPEHPPVARLDRVSHRFGDFQALREVSLQIERGDIYGLLGLNGAGKTTTLRALLGLLRHDSGEIELFGRPAARARLEVATRIGATIEAPAFYPHLDGRTNLDLLYDLAGEHGGTTPTQALETAGLAAAARVQVRKYSQGMLQRLYIAQALLGSPELLVLDEPTSNLDPRGILEVRRLIQRLNRDAGLTVLLSSHQLSEVEDVCNRVGILHRGARVVEASVAELFDGEECWVELEVDRVDDARAFLASEGRAREVELRDGLVRARLARSDRAAINAALTARGFQVSQLIERRPTLEDFFHEAISRDAD